MVREKLSAIENLKGYVPAVKPLVGVQLAAGVPSKVQVYFEDPPVPIITKGSENRDQIGGGRKMAKNKGERGVVGREST